MKKTKNSILFCLTVLLIGMQSKAQITGTVEGLILDKETGKGLFGVNVLVEGTFLGTASDASGHFRISRLPPGRYSLMVTMIGYEKESVPVSVQPNAGLNMTIELKPTVIRQPNLVITATKRRQQLEDAPTTVDVIQSEEILKRNPSRLDEVLTNTAGLGIIDGQVELRGSTGFNWAAGSRVLLMIDGHPMINGDTGGINWDAIPVEEVERVEIVKGAGSALYGSNAMAGMVNIITRSPSAKPELRFRVHWGFYDEPAYDNWRWTDKFLTYRILELNKWDAENALSFEGVDVSYSQKIRKTDMLMTVGRKHSTGYHQNGDFTLWNALIKTAFNFTPQIKWTLLTNFASNDHGEFIQWQSQSSPMTVPEDEYGNRLLYLKGSILSTFTHVLSHRMAYKIKTNWYRTDWENNFPDMPDYAVTDRMSSEVQLDALLRENHSSTFGTEIIYTRTKARIFGNENSLDCAAYGEDEFKITPRWVLTTGTRVDYHKIPDVSTDWQVSPRVGLVYHPAPGNTCRLSAGYGFRAPSLAEVFSTVNVAGVRVVPNLELKKAERAVSAELGVNQAFYIPEYLATGFEKWLQPKFSMDISMFNSTYENMIDVTYNDSLRAYQFMNLGEALILGLEMKIQASFWNGLFGAHIGWTALNHKDKRTHKPLPYRSDNRVVAGGEIRFRGWIIGVDYRYASRQKEIVSLFENDERVPMRVCDAMIQYDFGQFDISLNGKNIFNYNYTLRQRFLEPIRHYIVTLRGEL
ncbi:TonB-dependent receptor [bacterium]|nr:TonB-dependent receptor [bacterium]